MGQEENKNSRDIEWKMVEFMTKVEIIGKGKGVDIKDMFDKKHDWSSTKNQK